MRQQVERRLRALARRYVVRKRTYDDLVTRHGEVVSEKEALENTYRTWVPPGHFYSPIPDLAEVRRRADTLFDTDVSFAGIDLRDGEQRELFGTIAELAQDLPFPAKRNGSYRYFFQNPKYSWSDGIVLHAMLRHIRPRHLIEVGSGYSSAMTLDTTESWLGGEVGLTFIEPHARLLRGLLRPEDSRRVTILEQAVQDVPLETFDRLESGDVLFIDSTHVVKAGSDVNHLFFDVLPRLADGVWIHLHDIFFPFEYPLEWLQEGRIWQETYLLRSFLMYNPRFEIRWYQQYMWTHHRDLLIRDVPDMAKNPGGNIWLQKVAPG